MKVVLLKILQMSFEASFLIAVLLLFRIIFRRLPKRFLKALWILAAIRLVLPFGIPSQTSLIPDISGSRMLNVLEERIPSAAATTEIAEKNDSDFSGLPDLSMETAANSSHPVRDKNSLSQSDNIVREAFMARQSGEADTVWRLFFAIWLSGVIVLLLYFAASMLRLRRMIRTARPVSRGIYECSSVRTAFVAGLLFPKIILPPGMTESEKQYLLAHEQMHIRQRDHVGKIVAYLILSVHWFNPLVWAACICYSRDLEFACDENVTFGQSTAYKKGYAAVLLALSDSRRLFLPTAFGELSVKTRIQALLSEKKIGRLLSVFAGLAALAIIVCFMTSPAGINPASDSTAGIPEASDSGPAHDVREAEDKAALETAEYRGTFYWGVNLVKKELYRLFYLPDPTLPVQERIFVLNSGSSDNYTVLTEGLYSGTFVEIQGSLLLSDENDQKTLSLSSLHILPQESVYYLESIDPNTWVYLEEKLGIEIIHETEDDAWNMLEGTCSPTLSEEVQLHGMSLELKENSNSADTLELLCTRDAAFEAGRILEIGFVYLIFEETQGFENICYPESYIERPPGETSICLSISENPVLERVGSEPCKIILQYFSRNPVGKSTVKTISCLTGSDS